MNATSGLHVIPSVFNYSVESRNASAGSVKGSWTFVPTFALFTSISGTCANLAVLWLYYKRPLLRTPFGIYVINLLLADLITSCLFGPLLLVNYYYSSWTLGYRACVLRHYLGWTLMDGINISHMLIAVNRLWAVVYPVSYRTHHTKALAAIICASVWLILNCSFIPTVIIAANLTEPDTAGGQRCVFRTIWFWGSFVQLVYYDLPVLLVIFLYPIICYRSFVGTQRQRRVAAGRSTRVSHRSRLGVSQVRSAAGVSQVRSAAGVSPVRSAAGDTVEMGVVSGHLEGRAEKIPFGRRRPRYGSLAGFVTLTLMTLSVLMFLAPEEAYYTFLLLADANLPGVYVTVKVLSSLTPVVDPLLIIMANPELRKSVKDFFRRLMSV